MNIAFKDDIASTLENANRAKKEWTGMSRDYEIRLKPSSNGSTLTKSTKSSTIGSEDDNVSAISSVSGSTKRSMFSSLSKAPEKMPSLDLTPRTLHGRENETKVISSVFDKTHSSRQVLWLSGIAGSGKSALTDWLEDLAIATDAIYVTGKYTVTQQDEPYTAFAHICRRICLDIAGCDDSVGTVSTGWSGEKQRGAWCTDAETLASKFEQELGSQSRILARVVPSLELVVTKNHDSIKPNSALRLDERNQLHGAFRSFFRILSQFKTLVLVIDDLQWADQASLDLLDYLIRDRENSAMMVVGCYRDDEVAETHPFSKTMKKVEAYAADEDDGLSVTRMKIGNLDVNAVNEIVQSVLTTNSAEETLPLAQVIHARTLGNAFFSLQFIRALAEDNLIELDMQKKKFTWNLDQVKLTTTATADAVELMQSKLEKLPPTVKNLVRLASALGTTVHTDLFALIEKDLHENKRAYFPNEKTARAALQNDMSAGDVLAAMVDEGLMYRAEKKVYRWEHDKILEAAMIPKSKRARIYLHIGEMLQKKLNHIQLDQHLFVVVRLLNEGSKLIPTTNSQKRVNLAELNLRAGKKSIDNSGFSSAQAYFTKGISMLPSNHGRVYQNLSLDLFSSAAESEYCIGDVASMEKHCRDVIARPNIPLQEKRRVYTTLMDGLNAQGKCAETVDLSIEVLGKLGCVIPKRCLIPRILSGIVHMKSIEKRGIAAELDKVPPMSDPDKLWAMDILADLFKYAYLADMPNLVAVVLFKSFQWSIKYGRSPKVSMFLAQVGMLASSIGEYRVGQAYVDQSLIELETRSTEKLACDVIALIYTLAWHWTNDVDFDNLARGHAAGIAAGVAENAR